MAETKKKKSFEEWYEETYGGGETSDEKEQETVLPDIAPPTQGGTNVFSGKKTNPIGSVDIAPGANGLEQLLNQQKAAKQENQKGFFNKGNAFSDGWKFGDGIKTKAATAADAIIGAAEGAGGLLEGVTDWLAYGVAQAGEKIDPDAEWHKMLKEGAMQNTLGDASGVRDLTNIDDYTLLGNKTRGVLQGVGQVVTQIAAGQLGTPVASYILTYLSSTGSGMGEAYIDGATDQEAAIYGTVSGAVNTLSEFMFAGLGKFAKAAGVGKGLGIDDALAKKLTDKIAKPLLRNGIQIAIKSGGEGLEEVVAGGAEAIAKKLVYEDEKTLRELLKDEQLLDQFVMGALVSGAMQGGDLVSSVQSGTDMITGESIEDIKNAQNVVNTLAEEQIAASEKDGKKLTAKQKADIKKDIEQALERGELNTDDIERIVGGEDYTKWKKEIERQKALDDEVNKLLDTEESKMTVRQRERLAELRAKKSNKDMVDALKARLDERVAKATATGALSESYVERARRGQKFEADLTKYSKEEAAIVKKAAESGFLNNTRATHDFVDLIARICAKKGISFDFLNNEMLKKSGFSVNGATVNGYWDKKTKTIGLNMNSRKAFKTVVGHEITHVLEGTELYKDFRRAFIEYAKSKGDYDGRYNTLKEIYKNKPGTDIDGELVADLVGDYIFSDEAFLKRLSVENRNVFQKLWDEVKYLHRLATAGSEQAKELERIKRMFEKVFEETSAPDYKPVDGGKAEVVDGIAVAENTAEVMKSPEYKKPDDYMEQFSVSTEPAWEESHLAANSDEAAVERVNAIRDFTEKMVQDDAVRGYVPMGEYKYDKRGPLRTNQEYIWTFDMDTSCPRTFQFLNFRDAIQRKAGRYLTYNESINLLELMRAYGQQIPCCYCYVENKRVLLSASYNNFFGFRNAVMNAKTDADAEKVMYGYSEKKGLPEASRKALARWRSDMGYNPSLTDVWMATNTARNSVLNFLDSAMASGEVNAKTAQAKMVRMVNDHFGVTNKAAVAEIRSFVKDWSYDKLAGIEHIYNIDNDTDVSAVDERALALNREAMAYAKSSSSAKNVDNYVPYTDQLKNVSKKDRDYILGMGGIRKHSSNDFRMDYVQDYFMFYADLAAGKWTGHTYTKSADFVKIFACTKDRINMSVAFYEDADGTLRENLDEGASWKDVKELRKAHKNVGGMAMVTSDAQLSYALNADWIDMIIPFHASGLDKAVWYNLRMWNDYTTKQGERFYNSDTMKQKLTEAGVGYPKNAGAEEVKQLFESTFNVKHIYGKKGEILKPHFFPGDTYVNGQLVPGHHNDVETYFRLCEEYGVHPRFYGIQVTDKAGNQIEITQHPEYLKLIKETARTDSEQETIEFNFGNYDDYLKMTPFEYAMKRLQEEAKNGGFENTKADPYGVVNEFINEYLGKDRPLGYLTERAKETREILLEMSRETAQQRNDDLQLSLSSPTDQSYLDAVARGDTETAQRMVDEAAKAAGYTVKAYHGTKAFGFTKIDVSKSDDGISFFATDSVDTAGTYSVDKRVKRIADAGEYVPDEKIEEMEEEGYDAMVDVAEFCNAQLGIRGWTDEERLHKRLEELFLNAENEAIDSEQVTEKIYEIFDDLYSEFAWAYHDNWYENSNLDEDEYMSYEEWEDSYEADQLSDKFYSYVDKIHSVATALLSVNGGLGIYSLYINTDNNLVVDCHGSKWDKISSKDLPDIKSAENQKYGYRSNREYWTTRIVAKYAKDNGYGGVTFKNVVDTNDGSGWAATVYISFDPQAQVKSADPVTYDDNGNVIPLSERFKSDNNDIRFSLSPETSQGVDRIALENIAPTREQIAEMKRVTTPAKKVDALPMRKDIAPKPKVKMQPSQQVVTTGSNIAPPVIGKERSFAKTAIKSDAVDEKVSFADLSQESTHYVPVTNAVTLTKADDKLVRLGYDKAVKHVNAQINTKKVSLEDIALGERLIQEAVRRGDTKTAAELIQNVAILGTELGQKVQALSIIKRLTPAGQLRMLEKVVERGKARGDKAFEGVELTQEMKDEILKTYNEDGVSYDQDALNKAVEDVKQRLADKMKVTTMERLNAWRYLAMLGNPKTHIRNIVSNVAMLGTSSVKNAVAKSIEPFFSKDSRTKTWGKATQSVKTFADNTATEEKDNITGDGKYSESASIKDKRKLFRLGVLNKLYGLNNDLLSKEDWWFSKTTYKNSLAEFLTANGIKTADDIKNNPELVEKGKQYAMEQAQIATFRQYSYIASKIGEIERKNAATEIAIGAVLPFKKTPINIAKTALNYSPLGFAKTITYDAAQVKSKKMEASTLIDHLAQNLTGTSLVLLGYALAKAGFINGAGDDDKEGEYDYQLGKQAYSVNIGGSTYSLSWLSPTAMPLFIGANAFEILEEKQEWNGDVVVDTLAQTLDPLSEMSFLSSLDDVLSSYDSGVAKFAGIASSAAQSYVSQYIPTLVSQVASVTDDKKRTTKVASDSDFKFADQTINQLLYKIPGLRQTLEPSTDIWGKTIYQNDDIVGRAVETFIAPWSRKELIANEIDAEIKELYSISGDTGVIPSIPTNHFVHEKVKYEMSEEEYTEYKQVYGRTANILLERLFATSEYKNASAKQKTAWVKKVYDIAKDDAKENFLDGRED